MAGVGRDGGLHGGSGGGVSASRGGGFGGGSGSSGSAGAGRGGGIFGGYTSVKDMFDGGGPGASGARGGALGAVGGIFGGYTGLRDMVNGGGPGAAGPSYSGGPMAGIGNALGIGPFGGAPGTRDAAPAAAPVGFRGNYEGAEARKMLTPAPSAAAPSAPVTPALSGEEVSRMNEERSRVPTYEAGGYVGKGGAPIRPTTGSLDLPPALARMIAMPMRSYAEGGMVGPGGMPQRPMASPMAMNVAQQGGAPVVGVAPPGQQGRPLNFAAIDQQAQQFMQQHPQQVEQIRAEVQSSIAEGELDPQSLNMFVQIATTALQNPEMWPQLRQVLIRQGMLDDDEVAMDYDQGFLIILYIIGKTMGGGQATTPAPMSAGQAPEMSMAKGGALPAKSENPDGSIPINAHEGEYVIPADVTRKLGTDHFDKLIAKARGVDGKGEQ